MKVNEYMAQHNISEDEMLLRLGVAPKTLENQLSREIRPSWLERLGDRATPNDDGSPADGRRRAERPPTPPDDAERVQAPKPSAVEAGAPEPLNYGQIEGWIAQGYKLAADRVETSDPPLAKMIRSHAAQAGHAWAKFIEVNPRIVAFLQRMMISTPLGELVGVHLAIGFGYFFARKQYEQELEARVAAEQAAAADLPFAGVPGA